MKLLPVFLVISLAANAAFLTVRLTVAQSSDGIFGGLPGGTAEDGRGTKGSLGASPSRSAAPATGEGRAIAAAFNAGDAEALRDELRAVGVDEDLIRSIVSARIWKRFEDRMKAFNMKADPKKNWWKNDDDWYNGGQNKEQRAAMKALQREIKAERDRVLGKDAATDAASNPWLERQYGFVAPDKREALQQMEQDYNELSNELRRDAKGFQMPSDAEKAKFIQDEKRRDLAEILSPEELADYDRRQSRTAQNLRWQMTQMDATEEEYLAIFEIRKDFDERYKNDFDNFGNRIRQQTSPEQGQARAEAEKAMKAQLKEALGPDRYQAYVWSNDHDYQQLTNATKRFELPTDTPLKVFRLRDEVPRAALQIADDGNLTLDQKKQELTKLADQTREKVRGALGAEVSQVYFDNNGMQWLNQLEQGTIITFNEDGGQTRRKIDAPPRENSPKKQPNK